MEALITCDFCGKELTEQVLDAGKLYCEVCWEAKRLLQPLDKEPACCR